MIPDLETRMKSELERRIIEALPALASAEEDRSDQVVIHVERRTPRRCYQEQPGLRRFGEVEALVSVVFHFREDVDMSPLLASFMERPALALTQETHATCVLIETELAEGPHIDQDVWIFRVVYPVFDVDDGKVWEAPEIHAETVLPDESVFPVTVPGVPSWEPR